MALPIRLLCADNHRLCMGRAPSDLPRPRARFTTLSCTAEIRTVEGVAVSLSAAHIASEYWRRDRVSKYYSPAHGCEKAVCPTLRLAVNYELYYGDSLAYLDIARRSLPGVRVLQSMLIGRRVTPCSFLFSCGCFVLAFIGSILSSISSICQSSLGRWYAFSCSGVKYCCGMSEL